MKEEEKFQVQGTAHITGPPSKGFSRQGYWSGVPFPSPGDPPHPGIEPGSPSLQADALPSEPPGKPCCQGRKIYDYILTRVSFAVISNTGRCVKLYSTEKNQIQNCVCSICKSTV